MLGRVHHLGFWLANFRPNYNETLLEGRALLEIITNPLVNEITFVLKTSKI